MSDLRQHGRRADFGVLAGSASRALDGNAEADLRRKGYKGRLVSHATAAASDRRRERSSDVELDGIS